MPSPSQVYVHSAAVKSPTAVHKHKAWIRQFDQTQQAVREQEVLEAEEEQRKAESVAKFSEVRESAQGCVWRRFSKLFRVGADQRWPKTEMCAAAAPR
jgi:hypothetical protein